MSKPFIPPRSTARSSGYVREWRKDIGAKVRQGDVLAVIETPELDQRIAVAESELVKAKANQALAQGDGAALELAARLGGGVAAGRRRKGRATPERKATPRSTRPRPTSTA